MNDSIQNTAKAEVIRESISHHDHLRCNESNMNSDTSQEILKYQKEWAKQFHEQVGMSQVSKSANSKVREYKDKDIVKTNFDGEIKSGQGGVPESSMTCGESS